MPDEVALTMVTMVFDTPEPEALAGILSTYVVLTRHEAGCRNVDLCASATVPGRLVIIEKWASPEAQRAHFDGETMVAMAGACAGLLTGAPAIDLLEPVSAHDLR
jgi:quinol monooxygenase YgiN